MVLIVKSYINILKPTDKDGKAINSKHIRMKGIPTPCFKYYAQRKGTTVLDVYKQIFNNKSIKFDLTGGGNKYVEIIRIMLFQM